MHHLELPALQARPAALGPFAFTRIAGGVLLTNDAAEWSLLDEATFAQLVEGELPVDHPRADELRSHCFLRDGADLDALAARVRRKKAYLTRGPHLHVLVTTTRCNQSCSYCHASRRPEHATGVDMSLETARGVVDRALRSTSPYVNFEFQGGEPTLNPEVIRFVVDYAREKNRHEGKQLDFSLVTNLTTMTEELGTWLVDAGVYVCTSLDGPADLHDANRPWRKNGSAHAEVVRWIRWFAERYAEQGKDPRTWHVDALLTTTRATLGRIDDVLDEYVALGIRSVHLRPLNPYGFASEAWKRIGYSVEEFLAFYAHALDRILERNLAGEELVEGTAAVVLGKMLTPDDPGYVDLRSPCGAGIGQVAYDHDGGVYPCDEARMLAAQGDRLFQIGQVGRGSLGQDLRHPTVKAMAVASLTEALPTCSTCWNRPFCGVCPMHSWQTSGDLFGQRAGSDWCKRWMGVSTAVMERLLLQPDVGAVFERWTQRRERDA